MGKAAQSIVLKQPHEKAVNGPSVPVTPAFCMGKKMKNQTTGIKEWDELKKVFENFADEAEDDNVLNL
jgi:hypothetical protein